MKQFKNTYAVIMAGGEGRRLWPLSTPQNPKQFITIFGGKPLIRHAVDRLKGFIPAQRVIVVTASDLVTKTRKALPDVPSANIIGEPCRRDTAGAVAIACAVVKKFGGDDAVGCILPADNLITPPAEFRRALRDAASAAAQTDAIVTIGVRPDRPASEYGYIECAGEAGLKTKTPVERVRRFVEKPDAKTARRYLASGRYLWNAGIFVWRVRTLEGAFSAAAPDIGGIIRPLSEAKSVPAKLKSLYPHLRRISFDYAVMEKTEEILVARGSFGWDDVGSLQSLSRHFPSDENGNTCIGKVILHEVGSTTAVSQTARPLVVAGIKDAIIVQTDHATLVISKDCAGDMKKITAGL